MLLLTERSEASEGDRGRTGARKCDVDVRGERELRESLREKVSGSGTLWSRTDWMLGDPPRDNAWRGEMGRTRLEEECTALGIGGMPEGMAASTTRIVFRGAGCSIVSGDLDRGMSKYPGCGMAS